MNDEKKPRRTIEERQAKLAYQIFCTCVSAVKVAFSVGDQTVLSEAVRQLNTALVTLTESTAKVPARALK